MTAPAKPEAKPVDDHDDLPVHKSLTAVSIPTSHSESKPSSMTILDQAKDLIHGDRAQAYGSAEESFARIGAFWTTYLGDRLAPGQEIDAYDVAMLMTLMKVSRAVTAVKTDTFVDIAGYAALAERTAEHAGRKTS